MLPTSTTDPGVLAAFAADASGLVLTPDAVARPTSADEVREVLRAAHATGARVTPAGALTGYSGGAVTDEGTVLSLRAMDRVLDVDPVARTIRAEPGALLGDVKRVAAEHGLLLAPDPTSEEECSVGGAVAANASGGRSLKYGATRAHVRGLTVALADGRVLDVRRPRLEKNTAGYALAHDPVDWFVGSEGTLGVVLAAEFDLLPLPVAVTGLGVPFRTPAGALAFVAEARAARDAGHSEAGALDPRCLEYLDAPAFAIARDYARQLFGGAWGEGAAAYVYLEEEHAGEPALDAWLALAERHEALADDIQVFEGEGPLHDARRMRHAVPATLNERAAGYRAAGGRKVSTDWAVPYPRLAEALDQSAAIAAARGVEVAAVFGHAGERAPAPALRGSRRGGAGAGRRGGGRDAADGARDGGHGGRGARGGKTQAAVAAAAAVGGCSWGRCGRSSGSWIRAEFWRPGTCLRRRCRTRRTGRRRSGKIR